MLNLGVKASLLFKGDHDRNAENPPNFSVAKETKN